MDSTRTTGRRSAPALALAIAMAAALLPLAVTAADPAVCGTDDGTGCAPMDQRVDLATPVFSNPTAVTNPLHPTASLRSELLMGIVEDLPFRVEVTLMPETRTITIDGVAVEAVEAQYTAFLDGRIQEVALDWYAQADDGSVWYLGEDVFNYEDGVVVDTDGTWMAGRDGPGAMITPADPQPGDVYRPENIPGLVFEEVVVLRTGVTVTGPTGLVTGAIEIDELHMDGGHEIKIFAPGYGEFATGSGGEIEALALAVPIDAIPGEEPAAITNIVAAAEAAGTATLDADWAAATTAIDATNEAWEPYRLAGVPLWLDRQMTDAIDALTAAVAANDKSGARLAAIGVARAGLDLALRHRDPLAVDIARFELWLDQVVVDAAAKDKDGVRGDVASLEWTRDRFIGALDTAVTERVEADLATLRAAADAGDLKAASSTAAELAPVIAEVAAGA